MIEPDFVDDENIPLLHRDDDIDDSVYEDSQAETSFNNDDVIQQEDTEAELRRRERNLETLDVEINALERGFNVKIPPEERGRFRMSSGYLQVEKSPGRICQYLTKPNGTILRRKYHAQPPRSATCSKSAGHRDSGVEILSRVLLKKLDIEMDKLPPQKLKEDINEVMNSIGTNTDLDMREFDGIDKALTRIQGELANNAGKLTEIDAHIAREQGKLAEIETSPDLQVHEERVKATIADLKEERAARLELLSQNRKELASQFSRIRQTVEKILDGDLSLREKLKLVFREHGLTITAVLTSIGLIISTIVTALTGGSAGGSSTPPKNPNLKEWVKNKLKALARLLGRLAGKAAAALPGIIGSIIAGVLNFLKKVVAAAAGHVWLFLLSIATLIGYKIVLLPSRQAIDSFQKPNRKKR